MFGYDVSGSIGPWSRLWGANGGLDAHDIVSFAVKGSMAVYPLSGVWRRQDKRNDRNERANGDGTTAWGH